LPGSTAPVPPTLEQQQTRSAAATGDRPPMRRYKSDLAWRPLVQNGAVQNIINAAAATASPKVKRSESEYCFQTLATSLQVGMSCSVFIVY
jgi:hypothetical protein